METKQLDPSHVAADLLLAAPAATGPAPQYVNPGEKKDVQPAPPPPISPPAPVPGPPGPGSPGGPGGPGPGPQPGTNDKRPFDPLRFKSRPDGTPFINKHGFYMPIGGGKKAPPLPSIEPFTGPPAWSEPERAAATPPDDPNAAAAPGSAPMPAPPPPLDQPIADNSADAAEVMVNAIYFTTGALIGDMDEATPTKPEHENFLKSAAAYIRTTGWRGTAGMCFILRILAYLLMVFRRPKAAAKMKDWIQAVKKAPPVRVVPSSPPVTATPRTAGGSYVGYGMSERAG